MAPHELKSGFLQTDTCYSESYVSSEIKLNFITVQK
jgi:hypothetical protein